jgi:amino acid transporter
VDSWSIVDASHFMKIQLIKLLVFVALMGGFYAFDGFERPVVARDEYRGQHRMARAWIVTVVLFVAGSVMAVWGNALAQQVDWHIPDGLYPIIGVLLLIAGFVWMLMTRDSIRI